MFKPYLIKNVTYPLDGLSVGESASVARQLSSKHKKAFTAFRSNDSAELDIGFRNGELDTNTLMNFIGSNSGYVKNLYGVNGSIFTADSSSKYPRIVNSGILERDFDTAKAAVIFPTFASAASLNIFANGDFVNTTGISGSGATLSAANNTLSVTGNGTTTSPAVFEDTSFSCVVGKRIYLRAKVTIKNSSAASTQIQVQGSGGGSTLTVAIQNTPTINNQYVLSGIVTLTDQVSNVRVRIRNDYADAATANGKVMEVQEVVCIDVTNYGKPAMYFDGVNDALWCSNNANIDITSQPLYLNGVFSVDVGAANGYLMAKNTDATSNNQFNMIYFSSPSRVGVYVEGDSANFTTTIDNTITKGIQTLQSFKWEKNTMLCYNNGVASGDSDTYSGSLTSRNYLTIGARQNSNNTQASFLKGKISEFHILKGNPKQTNFEQKIKKYYAIA